MPKHTIEAIVNPNVAPTAIGQHWINTASKRHWLSAGDSLVGDWIEQTEDTAITDGDRGDITVSASGATWTVDAGTITLAKMANIATQRFIGRTTASTGVPEALTPSQATAILDTFTGTLKGLVPASGGGTSTFLRADGTFAAAVVSDGDKGDITVSASGATWTIDNSVVTTAKLGGDITTAGKAILDDADATAQRATLGLVIGTNVQAYDAELAAIAGLTSAANKGITFTGSGTASTYDLTAAALTVLDDATVSAMVDTLGGASSTGTNGLVRATSPTLVTPTLGVASATSLTLASPGLITVTGRGNIETISDGSFKLSSSTVDYGGTLYLSAINAGAQVSSAYGFYGSQDYSAIVLGAAQDAKIYRIAANHLGLHNSTSAQSFSVYNVAGTDYERGVLDWQTPAGLFRFGTEKGGAGTARALALVTDATERIRIDASGNLIFGMTASLGGGVKVINIGNATTAPTTNPTGGGILYCEAGALKYRGTSGTVTTLGAA